MSDIAQMLADEFRPQGYTIHTRIVPYFVLWLMSFFNRKMVVTGFLEKIGRELMVDNTRVSDRG